MGCFYLSLLRNHSTFSMRMKSKIVSIVNELKKISNDLEVFVIVNTLKPSTELVLQTSEDELFSRTEFAEIASAIYDAFGFVRVFYSESEFLFFVLSNSIDTQNTFVFNFARNGTKEGKKSLIPAFCDLYDIRYTGSNAFVISFIRNKFFYYSILKNYNIPIPKFWLLDDDMNFIDKCRPITNTKIIAKCNCEAASIGLSESNIFTYNNDESYRLNALVFSEKKSHSKILLQEYIDGIECEVLVLNRNKDFYACEPIELIIENSSILTQDISNSYRYNFRKLSDTFSKEICDNICNCSEQAAKILGIKDYARFDFRIDKEGNFFLIDIAGTPYLIKHSSIAYLFTKVYNFQYKDIFKTIASLTLSN